MVFIEGFFGLDQMSPVPSVIKAKAFQVIGDKGQVLAAMGVDPNGYGKVGINNAEGEELAAMGVDSDGNGLVVTGNAAGKILAEMGAKGHL